MHTLKTQSTNTFNMLERGISLLESLIAIAVMALGILGILGVQMRTLTDTQNSARRAQAIRLIEDLGERMKVNPNALTNINTYVTGWTATPPTASASKNCSSSVCSHTELAAYDMSEWKRLVERALPLGNSSTFLALADGPASSISNRRQLGVMIRWRENERFDKDTNYSQSIDGGVSRNQTGDTILTSDPVACPADFTCHLQYLPVSARCAPDFRGGASAVQFFCSGG